MTMRMENEVLEDIRDYAVRKLNKEYDFCGCAISDDFAFLNSSDRDGNDIKVKIEIERS